MATTFNGPASPSRVDLKRGSPAVWYSLASIALLGLWVGFYLFSPFGFDEPGRDSWHHAAVLRELMIHPFAPSNPHLPTGEASRYYTPVALVAALVGKALGLSPYALFGVMGAASCIGLVAGCWLFARRYYQSPSAPLILLLTLLFAWGAQIGHTGLHTYATWLTSAAYPATICLVLGLFSWALALDTLESPARRPIRLLLLGLLTAVTLLTHQLSGVIVLAGTGSLILFHKSASVRSKSALLVAMTLGTVATLAWPYFHILDVISSASDPRWQSAVGGMNRVSTMMLLAAPTFIGLVGFRKPGGGLRLEILFPALVFSIAYVVLTVQGSAIAHRIPPAIILYNQLGLVWLILGFASNPRAPQVKVALTSVALVLVAYMALLAGADRLKDLRLRAERGSMIATAEAIAAAMPPGSVAFATERIVFPLQSTGRRVVSIPRPEPAAPSLAARQAATDRFFGVATSRSERLRLVDQWGATHIVFVPADLAPEVVGALRTMGPVTTFSNYADLVTIDRASATVPAAKGKR